MENVVFGQLKLTLPEEYRRVDKRRLLLEDVQGKFHALGDYPNNIQSTAWTNVSRPERVSVKYVAAADLKEKIKEGLASIKKGLEGIYVDVELLGPDENAETYNIQD
jgi:hypothetical protein